MSTNPCLENMECRPYCTALNALAGQEEQNLDACEWPTLLASNEPLPKGTTDPELAQEIATEIGRILSAATEVRTSMEDPDHDLAVAYKAIDDVFQADMALWDQYATAAKQNRPLTDIEVRHYTADLNERNANASRQIRERGISSETLVFARAMHDRETLVNYGLLFDDNMCRTVTTLCANASGSKATLLIGDKGIAKTQAAKFVSRQFAPDGKPRFLSGDGTMMKDEFIGKMTLAEEGGATVTMFEEGMLTECMDKGIPLVLDEVNLIDPAIAMRLQDILLRKPGDTITLQEDSGREITIRHGFCVFATANEASARYHSRSELDPAFRDRFNVLPIEYPDGDTPILMIDRPPTASIRLANAWVMSKHGVDNVRIVPQDAEWIARVAHASQQLYSKAAKEVGGTLPGAATAGLVDQEEPPMSDCITPRKMVEILESVSSGLNPYVLSRGVRGTLYDTVAGMQRQSDRAQMFEIIRLLHDDPDTTFDAYGIRQQLRVTT